MDATRFPLAEADGPRIARRGAALRGAVCLALVLALGSFLSPARARAAPSLRDVPVIWYEDDRHEIAEPRERDPNLLWDSANDTVVLPFGRLTHPGRLVRRVGTLFGGDHVLPAANVNSLDEAPNSTWFTNRLGIFPMTPEETARGPGAGTGPDRSGPWTVVKAKSQGVTPGFNIRDASGAVHLIKFDPPGDAGMTTAAGVISNRILYAAGYEVPEDVAITFRREDLVLGEGVSITLPDGSKRTMTLEDLDGILLKVDHTESGEWRALASRLLPGRPVGPFDYKGRRKDDPNDHVNHEDRRELRGLRMFAAWLNHYDTKQHNSLDMFLGSGGRGYVQHYLIDFASTLGGGAIGAFPRYGWEYTIDMPAVFGRILAVGTHEDAWRTLRRPERLSEVGYWESERFDPLEFKPLQPNTAFANLTDRDGYWAAKIISAFTDRHLEAIVAVAGYQNPEAAAYVARVLGERRDKIVRLWFERVPPLDFFTVSAEGELGLLSFHDLGVERGLYEAARTKYRVRRAAVSSDRPPANRSERSGTKAGWSDWVVTDRPETGLLSGRALDGPGVSSDFPLLAFEWQVDRGAGWSPSVTAYVASESKRVVAVDR